MSATCDSDRPLPPRRKIRWRDRLWVRVGLVLMLIVAISLFAVWLPRRTAFAVRWHGGATRSEVDLPLARQISLSSWFPTKKTGRIDRIIAAMQWLSLVRPDEAVTGVDFENSNVDDHWLAHFKRFPDLTFLALHDRHLGPGLDELRRHSKLTWVTVHDAADGHLTELLRLPQLQGLELFRPKSEDLGLESLQALEQLKRIAIYDAQQSSRVIEQLQPLVRLEALDFERCKNVSDDGLIRLNNHPHLRSIGFHQCSPIGDAGLEHLSRIETLETLVLTGSLGKGTDKGIQSICRLKKLKQLVVSRKDLTPDQLATLQRSLPNCRVSAR